MKFDFTDFNGQRYEFELDPEPGVKDPHIEITVCKSSRSRPGITIRRIIDGKIKWEHYDLMYLSQESMHYLDKVIRNKAFL